jgi:predicted lipoprotein
MIRAALSLVALIGLLASAGAQTAMSGEGTPIVPTATEADYARVVEQAVTGYIVPAYAQLHAATDVLASAVEDFCAAPNPVKENTLRTAFDGTIRAWAKVDFLRFGPMAQEGRYERFAFFPDVHGTGARQIRRFLASKDEKLLKPGALAGQSAAVQGLPALESLIFSGKAALLQPAPPEPFRCALAVAVAKNMQAIADEAIAGWQGEKSWAALIGTPGPDNPVYRTHSEAMTEILKAILTGLEQVRDHRLMPALGETPADAKASRAPYNASGEALVYIATSAEALQRFADLSGILALLPAAQSSYGNSVGFEFSNLKKAVAAAGPDLGAALADPRIRSKLSYAAIVLQSLRDLFQRHVAVWAGLTPGFNSLDGD